MKATKNTDGSSPFYHPPEFRVSPKVVKNELGLGKDYDGQIPLNCHFAPLVGSGGTLPPSL